MNKNMVLEVVRNAIMPYSTECGRAGERKNASLLYFKDIGKNGFLITIEDEVQDFVSLQDRKTAVHKAVCKDLIELYVRNQCDEDSFSQQCSVPNNRARVIASYLASELKTLEGFVLTDTREATEPESKRAVYQTTQSLAYFAIAGLVELGDASAKETVFEGLCKELNTLYDKKNRDYDDAFAKSLDKYGPTVLCIRLSDKLNRFNALAVDCRERAVNDENIFDTLKDFANYAILTLVEMRMEAGDSEDSAGQNKLAEYEATGLQPEDCSQLIKALLDGKLRYCKGRVLPTSEDTPTWFRKLLAELSARKTGKKDMSDTRCIDCPNADWIDMYGKIVWGCDMSNCIQDTEDNRY